VEEQLYSDKSSGACTDTSSDNIGVTEENEKDTAILIDGVLVHGCQSWEGWGL